MSSLYSKTRDDLLAGSGLTTALWIALPIILYVIYRRGLPKVIPGIPYNEGIGYFGDLPSVGKHTAKTGQFWSWLAAQNEKHQSALTQIFVNPFSSRPAIVLTDAREAQDILLRRNHEFDRSPFVSQFLRGIVPTQQIVLPTGDEWKAHRGLTKDLMTPAFLQTVSAPSIYECATDLINLWQKKTKLAKGKPFAADMDIYYCALDTIFDVAFGSQDALLTVRARSEHLSNIKDQAYEIQNDGSVSFPEPEVPEIVEAIVSLTESPEIALKSMAADLTWKVLAWVPWWAKAWKMKEDMQRVLIEKSVKRVENSKGDEQAVRSALDSMVLREMSMARKVGRAPDFHSRAFNDELFGYLVAGHDTTSTTTKWAVKYLADNQSAQLKFREQLRYSIPAAAAQKRQPTLDEIIHAKSPYVDAILEEMIRHARTTAAPIRVTLCDVDILGHTIPKGTDVFILASASDFFSPGVSTPEELRSKSSQAAFIDGKAYGSWSPEDIGDFKPERWLTRDKEGNITFDKMAGPSLPFSLGPRGCFGMRLAHMEFRVFLCLMVWNFTFDHIDGELGSHSHTDKLTRVPNKCFVKLRPVSY